MTGRISETAAALRVAAAEAGTLRDSLPGMLPFHLPSRGTGSLFGGLFGSHYIRHGADPSGLCCGSVEHYKFLVLGLRITDRYNSLAATPGQRGKDVDLGRDLLWILWQLRSVPRRIRDDLVGEGLVWCGPAFADYMSFLFDDYMADLHCHGTPMADLCTGERLQRAAAAVASFRAVVPPFSTGLVQHSSPRFAAVLLSALRASNSSSGSAVPLVPPAGGSGGAGGRHARLATELSALCGAICGRRGGDLSGLPGLDDAVTWGRTRSRAIRGGEALAGGADDAVAELFDEVLRRPGLAATSHTGRDLLNRATVWPEWMRRRAGCDGDGNGGA